MRKTAIAAGIALISALTSPAFAADMTTKAPKAARGSLLASLGEYPYCDTLRQGRPRWLFQNVQDLRP